MHATRSSKFSLLFMHTEAISLHGGQEFNDSKHVAVTSKTSVQDVI